MTPKEKAEELVDKFYQTTPNEAWINEPLGISEEYKAWNQAKQCALIAVDEILAIFYDDYQSMWIRELNFWHLVKQEIEAL